MTKDTGKLTIVLVPAGGLKLSPGDPDQLTGPESEKNVAVHPTQLCEGPLIFKTGFILTFLTLLPLQFFLSGLVYVQDTCPVGPAPHCTVMVEVFTLGPTMVPPVTVQL